jgi:hypothetical protein
VPRLVVTGCLLSCVGSACIRTPWARPRLDDTTPLRTCILFVCLFVCSSWSRCRGHYVPQPLRHTYRLPPVMQFASVARADDASPCRCLRVALDHPSIPSSFFFFLFLSFLLLFIDLPQTQVHRSHSSQRILCKTLLCSLQLTKLHPPNHSPWPTTRLV